MVNHHFRHHPNTEVKHYRKIPEILAEPDEVRMEEGKGSRESYTFVKKYDNHYHAVVVNVEAKTGRFVLYKTFFTQRKRPYKNQRLLKPAAGVDDVTTIRSTDFEKSAPAGVAAEAISALPEAEENIAPDSQNVNPKNEDSEGDGPAGGVPAVGPKGPEAPDSGSTGEVLPNMG